MDRLDFNTEYDTKYCIPLWLRDVQVKLTLERKGLGRIAAVHEKRIEPVAVACFGPSLRDTWEEIRDFKHVISCSGAHRFLIERGIIPSIHVEVDPRAHKVALLGTPHPDVIYLPCSACHPDYFDHLEKHGAQVRVWHVFSNEEEAVRVLPRGEWALTGGADVGLRSILIARFLGFRNVQVFGMDGCLRETSHAAEHPNAPKQEAEVEYGGQIYRTTAALLMCAKSVWHELNMLKDVRATFHGEGLVQAMARNYTPEYPEQSVIAMAKPRTISEGYAALNRKLYRDNLAYGVGGAKYAPMVIKLVGLLSANGHPPSVLDYGCGRGTLQKALPFPIWEYDPAIEGKEESPRPADLVVCSDVLEHVEPELLRVVLDDLRRCVKQLGYFAIHTGASTKKLADGRNTHLIQKDAEWWRAKLSKFFHIGKMFHTGPLIHIIVGRRGEGPIKQGTISVVAVSQDAAEPVVVE